MNKEKLLYERALITCMVMLFVCIVLKIFGVEWFNLDTSIPLLNKIDEIVMNSEVLSFLYSYVLLYINGLLMIMCSIGRLIRKTKILYTVFIAVSVIFGNFVYMPVIDTLMLLIICMIEEPKRSTILNYIGIFVLNILYQSISLYIRDLGFHFSNYGLVTSVLLNIDYYIMLVITYLYFKKGDTNVCSINHHFGSSLRTRLWKKRLQNSNPCSDKG